MLCSFEEAILFTDNTDNLFHKKKSEEKERNFQGLSAYQLTPLPLFTEHITSPTEYCLFLDPLPFPPYYTLSLPLQIWQSGLACVPFLKSCHHLAAQRQHLANANIDHLAHVTLLQQYHFVQHLTKSRENGELVLLLIPLILIPGQLAIS